MTRGGELAVYDEAETGYLEEISLNWRNFDGLGISVSSE